MSCILYSSSQSPLPVSDVVLLSHVPFSPFLISLLPYQRLFSSSTHLAPLATNQHDVVEDSTFRNRSSSFFNLSSSRFCLSCSFF
jgi:hypothetical protein